MIHWLINFLLYLLYVVVNAKEDSKLAKLGGLDHRWNWLLTALVAVISGYNQHGITWETVRYCVFLMPVTWILFDPVANIFLGKHPVKYIGTAWVDNWFKRNSNNPVQAMYITKAMTLVAALAIYLAF